MTLISENDASTDPSLEDLQDWANTYNLTHPVLADPGYAEILPYLYADPNFNGTIGLPNMQLLAPGMVVDKVNIRIERSDIEALIEAE
jgi:hypothetical protein